MTIGEIIKNKDIETYKKLLKMAGREKICMKRREEKEENIITGKRK